MRNLRRNGSPYSEKILEVAERIQLQLEERAEEAQGNGG